MATRRKDNSSAKSAELKPDAAFLRRVRRHVFANLSKHRKFHHLFDDIVSEVLFTLVSRKRGQTVEQAYIDTVRKLFGRTKGYGSKSGVDPKTLRKEIELKPEYMKPVIPKVDSFLFIDQLAEKLDGRDRIIFLLRFREDWTNKEISEHLGVSKARVTQYFWQTLAKVKQILNDDERFETIDFRMFEKEFGKE